MGIGEVTLVSQTTTERLDKIVLELFDTDFQKVLQTVALNQIQAQIDLNNPPTSILVDNRASKDIEQAERRIQAFFGDTSELSKAIDQAWAQVQALTRVKSGRAAASYQLWFKETFIGTNPTAADTYIKDFNPTTDYFRIVGPVLVYGRKVYWNPAGKPKFKKLTGLRGRNYTIKLIRIRGIMDQVEQSMRRRFRHLAIAEDWVVTSALPKDGRTPGLWIGFKRKGKIAFRK